MYGILKMKRIRTVLIVNGTVSFIAVMRLKAADGMEESVVPDQRAPSLGLHCMPRLVSLSQHVYCSSDERRGLEFYMVKIDFLVLSIQ